MKKQIGTSASIRRLLSSSALTIAAAAVLAAPQPALAWSLYGGGTSLSSLTVRQILDCYAGKTLTDDGNSFSSNFNPAVPSPNLLPTTCTTFATEIEALYAAVGSGNGQRGLIADNSSEWFRGSPIFAPSPVLKPSKQPPFIDSGNSNFARYPYPRVDFDLSASPLSSAGVSSLTTVSFSHFTPSTNWQESHLIIAHNSTLATYLPLSYGQPIQVPALEAPVAIAINVTNPNPQPKWKIQSALSPNTQAGGAIQLSTAQLCAIFSKTVTDWGDTTTLIPYIDHNGTLAHEHFYDANTNGKTTPVAYVDGHLPIQLVFNAVASGTSYILTNYLGSACPQLDPHGTYNYKKIFTGIGIKGASQPNLPSDKFDVLMENIRAVKGPDHEPFWIPAIGDAHAALNIGTSADKAGRIGYLSPDFTQPYALTISEKVGEAEQDEESAAPLSASIQNEDQREHAVHLPGQAGTYGSPQNFIPPTPGGAEAAFSQLTVPASPESYSDWNIYNQTYPAGSTFNGVKFDGLSQIGLPYQYGAYPITGVIFLQTYSCYADSTKTRVPALTNWLAWLFGGSDQNLSPYSPSTSNASSPGYDPDVALVIENSGFHEIDTAWADAILQNYIVPSSAGGSTTAIAAYTSGSQLDGCQGVTVGAK